MISQEKRFLFIHIPKTGGNSIQERLVALSDDHIVKVDAHHDGVDRFEVRNDDYPLVKHSTLREYKDVLAPDLFDSLFKFAVIRNPWDRLISHYFSPHRGTLEWDRAEFKRLVETVEPVRHYITCDSAPGRRLLRYGGRLAKRWLRPLDSDIDLLIRFENLEADFERVCERLGIEYRPLARRNPSPRGDYATYYDSELAELVAERFGDEVAFGGYTFAGAP